MNFFQIVVLVIVPCLALGMVLAMLKGWVTRRECLVWTFVCLLVSLATAWPQATSKVARAIGIGRGADLVSYCAVIVMLVGFWMVYLRLRRVQRQVTLLVRHLAISEAEEEPAGPATSASPSQPQPPA